MKEDRSYIDQLDNDELRTNLEEALDEIEWYRGMLKQKNIILAVTTVTAIFCMVLMFFSFFRS